MIEFRNKKEKERKRKKPNVWNTLHYLYNCFALMRRLFQFFVFSLIDSIAFSNFGFAYLNVLKCDLSRLIALWRICLPADWEKIKINVKIKPNGFCARHRKREGYVVCSIYAYIVGIESISAFNVKTFHVLFVGTAANSCRVSFTFSVCRTHTNKKKLKCVLLFCRQFCHMYACSESPQVGTEREREKRAWC